MFLLYKVIGHLAVPPGIFIAALAVVALLMLRRPRRCWSAAAAFIAFAMYAASTSAGALFITGPLETFYSAHLPPDGDDAVILVLGGGSSCDDKGNAVQPSPLPLERVFTAVRLANERGGRSVIVMSGGSAFPNVSRSEAEAMGEAARAMGYGGELMMEASSRTTKENMRFSARIVEKLAIKRVIVVTSAVHLPRAVMRAGQFMADAEIFPFPSGRLTDPVIRGASSFLPTAWDFYASSLGIKEYAGIAAAKITSGGGSGIVSTVMRQLR